MIFKSFYSADKTMALAGLAQSLLLVDQLAKNGFCEERQAVPCVKALLCQNPESFEEIFGSTENFATGLSLLPNFFSLRNESTQMPMRYMIQVIHLQKVFVARTDMVELVASAITNASGEIDRESETVPEYLYTDLSQLYQKTLSTLNFRIQVHGNHTYLNQAAVANKIRVLLFSAIRFSLLWQQCGGKRLDFMLAKKAISDQSKMLLKSH